MSDELELLFMGSIVVGIAGYFARAHQALKRDAQRAQFQLARLKEQYAKLAKDHAWVLDRCADYWEGTISADDFTKFTADASSRRGAPRNDEDPQPP
jgi:hypothetical protein